MSTYEFDVALSFAGEDRVYVDAVARHLRDNNVRVFYDEFETVALWGVDLYSHLDQVYRVKSRYAAVFASRHYSRKMWTSHERQSMQARALQDKEAYLLPVRLDGSDVPGLRPTVGYVDGTTRSPVEVAQLLMTKLQTSRSWKPASLSLLGVPLTGAEKQELLSIRPRGWEYLLWAGSLWQAMKAHEEKYLDHELRYAKTSTNYVATDMIDTFLNQRTRQLLGIVDKLNTIAGHDAQEWALGRPGEPGDPVRIEHLSTRFATLFEELLEWAAIIRGITCHDDHSELLELFARLADQPVEAMRTMTDEMVTQVGRIPEHYASGGTEILDITIPLTFEGDTAAMRAFADARRRLSRKRIPAWP